MSSGKFLSNFLVTYLGLGVCTTYIQYVELKRKIDVIDGQLNTGGDCQRYYHLNTEYCNKLRDQLYSIKREHHHLRAYTRSVITFPKIWFKWISESSDVYE